MLCEKSSSQSKEDKKMMSKVFISMEKELESNEKKVFVDYEVIAATSDFSAVRCTVANAEGKRIVRLVSDSDLSRAQELAGIFAMYDFSEKEIPTEFLARSDAKKTTSGTKDNSETTTHAAGSKEQSAIQTPPIGGAKATTTSVNVDDAAAAKAATAKAAAAKAKAEADAKAKAAAEAKARADAKAAAQAKATSEAANATNNGVPADAERSSDDFRIMIGTWVSRDDNYISQMVESEDGQKYLRKMFTVKTNSENLAKVIEQAKQYCENHNVVL